MASTDKPRHDHISIPRTLRHPPTPPDASAQCSSQQSPYTIQFGVPISFLSGQTHKRKKRRPPQFARGHAPPHHTHPAPSPSPPSIGREKSTQKEREQGRRRRRQQVSLRLWFCPQPTGKKKTERPRGKRRGRVIAAAFGCILSLPARRPRRVWDVVVTKYGRLMQLCFLGFSSDRRNY